MAFTILNGFRTRAKQTAIEVWKARFIWGDNDLVKANHASRVSLVAMGGLRGVAVRDDGHLSIFRALNRREVADHWVAMMRDWGEQRLNQWGIDWVSRWGDIEHEGFWSEASALLSNWEREYAWEYALGQAALNGNLVAFRSCPKDTLVDIAVTPHSVLKGQLRDGVVHPDVMLWLVQEGFVDSALLAEQVTASNFRLDLSQQRFMGLLDNVQCETGYVQDLCKGVLNSYGLTPEQRLRFVGHSMVCFGSEMWNKLAPAFEGHLDGIELDVLQAVCGFSPFSRNPEELELLNTLYKGTQSVAFPFRQELANEGMRNSPAQHEGLLFLMELAPPADRIDLYHLGVRALNVQRGLVQKPEVFVLPSLD